MRRRIYQACLSVVVALLLTMGVVFAQTSARVLADIPFDFHVGNATLPSGQYMIKSGFPTRDALSFQSRYGSRNAMTLTTAVSPSKGDGVAKLVFNRYGSNYFLSQVWNPSDSIVRGVWKSKAEMEVARNIHDTDTVAVALKKQ